MLILTICRTLLNPCVPLLFHQKFHFVLQCLPGRRPSCRESVDNSTTQVSSTRSGLKSGHSQRVQGPHSFPQQPGLLGDFGALLCVCGEKTDQCTQAFFECVALNFGSNPSLSGTCSNEAVGPHRSSYPVLFVEDFDGEFFSRFPVGTQHEPKVRKVFSLWKSLFVQNKTKKEQKPRQAMHIMRVLTFSQVLDDSHAFKRSNVHFTFWQTDQPKIADITAHKSREANFCDIKLILPESATMNLCFPTTTHGHQLRQTDKLFSGKREENSTLWPRTVS